ncbi:hypothetical protein C8R42DRAFT_708373 [Lentinula raphanica]|nr:hypothetical protein C8R42DRAFT_708373 [Lentinula raphanica]
MSKVSPREIQGIGMKAMSVSMFMIMNHKYLHLTFANCTVQCIVEDKRTSVLKENQSNVKAIRRVRGERVGAMVVVKSKREEWEQFFQGLNFDVRIRVRIRVGGNSASWQRHMTFRGIPYHTGVTGGRCTIHALGVARVLKKTGFEDENQMRRMTTGKGITVNYNA